jgi:methionyl-tRNA formyltransferase
VTPASRRRGLPGGYWSENPLRVLFLGQSCAASAPPLAALIAADHDVPALVLAGAPGIAGAPERLAHAAGIPVLRVASAAEAAAVIRDTQPDIAVAACFPWRLGRAARETPPLGILNVHPSLLPAGRGPEPVFWTLRRAERETGVTVHRMEAGLDTGPIVAQSRLPAPDGIAAPELERELMTRGGALLVASLPGLAAGTLHPWPQPATGVTHAPCPTPADWTMPASLPAAWAWRFARGVAPLGGPLAVISGGVAIPVAAALDYAPEERLPVRFVSEDDGSLRVRFTPGWVRFETAESKVESPAVRPTIDD